MLIAVVAVVIIAVAWAAASAAAPAPVTRAPLPRRADVADCGYPNERAWYDFQGQGVKNDFCRFVGGGASTPMFFACALAGGTGQYVKGFDPKAPHDPLAPGDMCYGV